MILFFFRCTKVTAASVRSTETYQVCQKIQNAVSLREKYLYPHKSYHASESLEECANMVILSSPPQSKVITKSVISSKKKYRGAKPAAKKK